jgi:hypothetical protein
MILAKRPEKNQFGQPAGSQPGKSALIRSPAKSKTSVSLKSMPPQAGGIELLASHRFYGVSKDCFDLPDFNRHFSFTDSRLSSISVVSDWLDYLEMSIDSNRPLPLG